jgi:hypothetical protein
MLATAFNNDVQLLQITEANMAHQKENIEAIHVRTLINSHILLI